MEKQLSLSFDEINGYDDMPELEEAGESVAAPDGFYHGWLQLGGKGVTYLDSLEKIH